MLNSLLNQRLSALQAHRHGLAFALCLLLGVLGFSLDRTVQRSSFNKIAEATRAELSVVISTTSEAVKSIANPPRQAHDYLTDIYSVIPTEHLTDIYLINDDGTVYSEQKGNPHQQYLMTTDDTDFAAEPILVNGEDFWRYHFLLAERHSTQLWQSPFTERLWLLTIPVTDSVSDIRNVIAIELNPFTFDAVQLGVVSAFQFARQPLQSLAGEPTLKKPPLSYELTDRLTVFGRWHFPRYAFSLPIAGLLVLLLIYLFSRLLSLRLKQQRPGVFTDILCDELNIMLFETDAHSVVQWVKGQLPEEITYLQLKIGQSVKDLLASHPRYLTYWQHTLSGEKLTYEIDDGQHCLRVHQWPLLNSHQVVVGLGVMIQNISEQRSLEYQLQHQQFHDQLTGLPNRQLFMEQLTHELHRAKRRQESSAVIALEISGIGHINKQFGHKISDSLLKLVSQNLSATLRSEDRMCRFSNDEFLVSFNDYRHTEELQLVAERLIKHASADYQIDGYTLNLNANIGIATFPRDALDAGSLISNAITAMRHARQTGRNTLDYFSADNARLAHEKWQLEQDITKALNAHDFTLHFQPIFDLKSNRCIAAEALIRWPGTDLRPDQFIPLAEETGLIHTIGIWVLEAAIKQFFEWKQAGGTIEYISINLSVVQLKDNDFFDNLDAILRRFPIEAGQVVLEITESVMMNSDASTVKKLNGLRERGFSLAIDDFGTGFSSLNYLKHLPINYLKVDRSFIKGVPDNPHDTVICEAIIQMSLAMELTIIAEGVEMPHQMNWLASKGVLCAQGYFYAHPVSAKDFQPYIGI